MIPEQLTDDSRRA